MKRQNIDKTVRSGFLLVALFSIVALSLIIIFLFLEGIPILEHVSLKEFLFGQYWYPTDDPADFGILPLILGSIYVTVISGMIAIPLGVMTAIYLAQIAPATVSQIVKPIVELLASMPSVVIGFFGMVVVAPFIQQLFNIPVGLNMFNASLMLAFMAVPTICSISEDAVFSVPTALKEASLALGATHFETLVRVIVPASLSGICTAIILGLSRAVGETMVVLMAAGGAAMIPTSIFDPVRPLPASIAAEMAEAPFRSEHYHALFAIGIVLFVFTFLFNLLADHISYKFRQVGEASL
ncbi:MAG: phosphate ABC transporter permease subunit PstC [Proteobacteria bacterium]|nr:phosphate ABC transporter permease subunit PstC [Pseudomonadota bacterium]MBU1388013.1 phosphate ABC transporter permease subunit PstC [Pseudomonadota bacterium]MBU1542076.1 phosphate ABC transporter permease subunit PstC [Pseudomonadota bacterium]MBU2431953.1 phosphate ABC transporter permease subunit PstC [Pseudomonadota bacterium]MBU2482860.1 phosphate ABC transporter permease subunit PstC [Pseudomonadota bacterium]